MDIIADRLKNLLFKIHQLILGIDNYRFIIDGRKRLYYSKKKRIKLSN